MLDAETSTRVDETWTKGYYRKAKCLHAMNDTKEKKKNRRQKKEKTPDSDSILNRRSSESDSKTTKDYSDGEINEILASSPSKYVARPKDESPMDAE